MYRSSPLIPLLTRRSVVLLVLGAAIPLVGLIVHLPLPVTSFLLFVYLFSLLAAFLRELLRFRRALSRIVFELDAPPLLYSGERAELMVHVKNAMRAEFEMRLSTPRGVRPEVETARVIGEGIAILPILPLERGTKEWRELFVRSHFLNGFLRYQWRMTFISPLVLTVVPNYRGVVGGERTIVASGRIAQRKGASVFEGREFHSLREYVVGDDLRRVDWKRSARGDSLYIREFVPESHQRIAIAIDCGRTMATTADDRLLIEYAADGAAVLCKIASQFKDEVSLLGFNHQLLTEVPFGSGTRHEATLIKNLIDLQVGHLDSDYDLFSRWTQRLGRRSLVILLSGIVGPARLEGLRKRLLPLRGRHLPMVVFMEDREIKRIAEGPVASLKDAIRSATAVEQQREVTEQIGVLTRSGVECLHLDPKHLMQEVEVKYRALKQLGRI